MSKLKAKGPSKGKEIKWVLVKSEVDRDHAGIITTKSNYDKVITENEEELIDEPMTPMIFHEKYPHGNKLLSPAEVG